MGNQQSLLPKGIVYEDQGKYIIPTKLKHNLSTEQQHIVNNIFGINDPTILTRSYWAKQNNQKSPDKSRRFTQSVFRYKQFQGNYVSQNEEIPQRQLYVKSTVTNFKDDHQTPTRTLTKMTSHSIISKLKHFQDENQSSSPLKKSQYTRTQRNLSYSRNKQNERLSKSRNISPYNLKDKYEIKQKLNNKKQDSMNNKSKSLKKSVLNDITIQNQMINLFGLSSIMEKNDDTPRINQQTIRQDIKTQRKTQAQNTYRQQIIQNKQTLNNSNLNNSNQINQVCQQTFSRHDQNNPNLSHNQQNYDKNSQRQNSIKSTYKTYSKNSCIQKYNGLNQDSHNQSLMKVLKRVSQIHLDQPFKFKPQSKIKNLTQNTSQIYNQNLNKQQIQSKNQSKLKSQFKQNLNQTDFKFDIKQIKCSQKLSQKSIKKSQSSNFSKPSNKKDNKYSQIFKPQYSQSKYSIHHLTQNNIQYNLYPHKYRFNEQQIQYPQNSLTLQQKDSQTQNFKFSKIKSPKSIASQQVRLTRQKSCAGRIIQTSKAMTKKNSSPFKSKKYDFTKKQTIKNDDSHFCQQTVYVQNSKLSRQTTKDHHLLVKIQTLQGELQRLKNKQNTQKFDSRRYSPVKQEKLRRNKQQRINQLNEQQTYDQSQYCINQFSKATPFKHRTQYFKLKLK